MSKRPENNMVVGLDIGTSKVMAIIGEVTPAGEIDIIGVGNHPARGMRRGVVANIESTVQSIQRAVEEAELMSGCQIYSVYAGIAGAHISSSNSHGVVAIRDREVMQGDVDRVIEAAQALAIPHDQKILHVLPQDFVIDGQDGVSEPIGMSGVRLEARVHIITGAISAVQNIVKCIQRCNIEVEGLVLEQLASSYAILSPDERELGVCLIDIGGGTTDIAVHNEGAIHHTAVIPIAGDQVTNDIALTLHTPSSAAEALKLRHGCALKKLVSGGEAVEVTSVGDRPPASLGREHLAACIESRVEELYGLVQAELRRSGYEGLIGSGIVLTGGSSHMEGMVELAEEVFDMPARLGIPQSPGGLHEAINSPAHATGVGLVLAGRKDRGKGPGRELKRSDGGVLGRIKNWFQGH